MPKQRDLPDTTIDNGERGAKPIMNIKMSKGLTPSEVHKWKHETDKDEREKTTQDETRQPIN